MSYHIRFEDWEAEQMKDWRFRFWWYLLWPSYQWTRLKIKFYIWRHHGAMPGSMAWYEEHNTP